MHYRIVLCVQWTDNSYFAQKPHIYEDNFLDRKLKCVFQVRLSSTLIPNILPHVVILMSMSLY